MIGHHVNKNGSYYEAINDAIINLKSIGLRNISLQIFVSDPKKGNICIDKDDIAKIKQLIEKENISLVVHGAYVNAPWNKNIYAVHKIKEELILCSEMGASGVIIHLSKKTKENINWFLDMIALHIDQSVMDKTKLWFEIGVCKEHDSPNYGDPIELIELYDHIHSYNKNYRYNVGICFDTAHLWSCGKSMTTYKQAKKWFTKINKIPNDCIMIHLNDSASEFGSGKDRHANLCEGNIWESYKYSREIHTSGLYFVIKCAQKNGMMCVLETPKQLLSNDLLIICNVLE